MNFAVPANHRVKIKVNKKINKYTNLSRELKKLKKMKIMIRVIVGGLGALLNSLEKRLEELLIKGRIYIYSRLHH